MCRTLAQVGRRDLLARYSFGNSSRLMASCRARSSPTALASTRNLPHGVHDLVSALLSGEKTDEAQKVLGLAKRKFKPNFLQAYFAAMISLENRDFNQALDIGLGERSATPVARSIFDLRSLSDLEGGEVQTGEASAARHPCLRRLTRVLGAQATTASAAPRGWGRADRGRRCSTRYYTCESSSAVHALCRRVHAWGPRQPSPTRILAARINDAAAGKSPP